MMYKEKIKIDCKNCIFYEQMMKEKDQQLAELKTEFEKRNKKLIKDNQILGNEIKRKEVQLADLQKLLESEHQFKDVVEKLNKSKDILLFEPRKAIEQFLGELASDNELTSESLIVKTLNMQSDNERLEKSNKDKDNELHGAFISNDKLSAKISNLKNQLKEKDKEIERLCTDYDKLWYSREQSENERAKLEIKFEQLENVLRQFMTN